jgi:tRNA pseudouridine55 synthase
MMGMLNILKTPGITSHGVISRIRRLSGIKKIGHAGTLDPQAAGVLPVCIGAATKMIPYMDHRKKTYRVEMKLGLTTDTQDMTGQIVAKSFKIPLEDDVKQVLTRFLGDYWQVPPMYSAIKHQGKKLYELARTGQEVERAPRKRIIDRIQWISMKNDLVLFDVVCSEGTYIRTLCHDAGQQLGCGATMAFLLRMESCRMPINEAVALEELEADIHWQNLVIPVDQALKHHPGVHVPESSWKRIANGMPVSEYYISKQAGLITALDEKHHVNLPVRVYLTNDVINSEFIGMGAINAASGQLTMKKRLPLSAAISF